MAQVFELAELVGRRPVGNVRQLADGGYRLRFQQNGEVRTAPEVGRTRTGAEWALWAMVRDGRADCNHDQRYRTLVLLATFASLRWGEMIALGCCDIDLDAETVRVRAAYVERSTGEIILGAPKSKAGRRIVGIPRVIIEELQHHLAVFVKADPGAHGTRSHQIPGMIKAQARETSSGLGLLVGAGDENRTRTISLGS